MNNSILSLLPLIMGIQNGGKPDANEAIMKMLFNSPQNDPSSTVFPSFFNGQKNNENGLDPMILMMFVMMMNNSQNPNAQNQSVSTLFNNFISSKINEQSKKSDHFQQDRTETNNNPSFEEIKDFSGAEILESLRVMTETNLP